MAVQQLQRPVGELLREWREYRRMSQMDLALQAEISTRHLSFVETSRSHPSREMLLHLADNLDVPLRERNHLLLAAGFAPVYTESALDSPQMTAIRAALRQVLKAHEPFPAVVVDRAWNLVDANASLAVLLGGVSSALLAQPANALRIALHPAGMAPRIVNLGEWRGHLLGRLRRQVAITADPALTSLYREVLAYPCDQSVPDLDLPGPGDVVVPLRLRDGSGSELSFFGTVSTFGTPLDITVAELAIESFYPADDRTRSALIRHSAREASP